MRGLGDQGAFLDLCRAIDDLEPSLVPHREEYLVGDTSLAEASSVEAVTATITVSIPWRPARS